jgi:antitoxin component of MazEF toxin-antitoxin module
MGAGFDTVIRAFGNNAGIEVPAAVLTELGAGKRPRVQVQVEDYHFATTIGAMSGLALISLSKAHREASGLQAGQAVHVELELDAAPVPIAVPEELAAALAEVDRREAFDQLAPSRRKEYARQISEAKTEPTRQRRLAKIVSDLA